MTICSNCFNTCTTITADKCVRYTGEDVSVLGITSQEPLSTTNQKIIEGLLSALNGEGISFNMGVVCNAIQQYLPTPQEISLKDITVALIQAVCDLSENVTTLSSSLEDIDTNYDVSCIEGTSLNLQDTIKLLIEELCAVKADLKAFKSSVKTTYVKIEDLNSLT